MIESTAENAGSGEGTIIDSYPLFFLRRASVLTRMWLVPGTFFKAGKKREQLTRICKKVYFYNLLLLGR